MALGELGFERSEPLTEANVTRLRVEPEKLEFALRLRQIKVARHRREYRPDRFVLCMHHDQAPRDHDEPASALGHHRAARRAAAKQIGK